MAWKWLRLFCLAIFFLLCATCASDRKAWTLLLYSWWNGYTGEEESPRLWDSWSLFSSHVMKRADLFWISNFQSYFSLQFNQQKGIQLFFWKGAISLSENTCCTTRVLILPAFISSSVLTETSAMRQLVWGFTVGKWRHLEGYLVSQGARVVAKDLVFSPNSQKPTSTGRSRCLLPGLMAWVRSPDWREGLVPTHCPWPTGTLCRMCMRTHTHQ